MKWKARQSGCFGGTVDHCSVRTALYVSDCLIYDHETGRGGLLQAGGHTSPCLHFEFQKCHVVPTGRYIIKRQKSPTNLPPALICGGLTDQEIKLIGCLP